MRRYSLGCGQADTPGGGSGRARVEAVRHGGAAHHGEGANLVELHHRGHGGEDADGVEAVAVGLHHRDDLVGQLLHEDERADEDVGLLDVLLELLEVGLVAQLLEDVARALDGHVGLQTRHACAVRHQGSERAQASLDGS